MYNLNKKNYNTISDKNTINIMAMWQASVEVSKYCIFTQTPPVWAFNCAWINTKKYNYKYFDTNNSLCVVVKIFL